MTASRITRATLAGVLQKEKLRQSGYLSDRMSVIAEESKKERLDRALAYLSKHQRPRPRRKSMGQRIYVAILRVGAVSALVVAIYAGATLMGLR